MITIGEASSRAGVGAETVRRWVRAGRLTPFRDGPRVLVDERELEALLGDRRLPAPPLWETAEAALGVDWVALVARSRGGRRCS